MTGGVQVDPHMVLRLVLGQHRARRQRVGAGSAQMADFDVQVHHHLLIARAGRPPGRARRVRRARCPRASFVVWVP